MVLVACIAVVACGGEPELWEEKGFDSKEACYDFYNYEGAYRYWCEGTRPQPP